ncbi:MAG TPA: aldose epimerase family protein [Solirubrobacteraceae bacterium]|nr:aldose epimerase family protein [Solirubrobacteraceae bacterium]
MTFAFASRRWSAAFAAGVLAVATALLLTFGAAAHAAKRPAHHNSGGHKTGHHGKPTGGKGTVNISSQPWGTADGQPVTLYTLSNHHRMTVKITNYGGVVQSIDVPDRRGRVADVALGFPKLSDYVSDFTQTSANPWPASGGSGDTYFGAIIGRYANRIANAKFTLNGTTYTLPANNGPNTLHGGGMSYNTKVWSATTSTAPGSASVQLTYTDPAGYNGFPGAVSNTVTYTLTAANQLKIHYGATTTAPTVVNYTNHTYFNLAGEGSGTIYKQLLKLNASRFTPVNANLIPTGQFASVAGTPFDFRSLKPIGRDIRDASAPMGDQLVLAHGYDHNWILDGSGMRHAATAIDPASGRRLDTYTTEPGIQVYTGNFLVGDLVGTSGHTYRQGDAFTLETQHYPDSPNHIGDPNWPSVVLNPGQTFDSTTVFAFSTTGRSGKR